MTNPLLARILLAALMVIVATVPALAEPKSRYSQREALEMSRFEKRVALTNLNRERFALGDYAALDRELNALQAQYEKGEWTDNELWALYNHPLQTIHPLVEQDFNAWVKAYPRSFAALQARGNYYLNLSGWFMAGATQLDKVPAQWAAQAKHFAELAFKDNLQARGMTAKPILADSNLITLQGLLGARDAAAKVFARIDKTDPSNLLARYRFMDMLKITGAGSDAMRDFMTDIRKRGIDVRDVVGIGKVFHKKLLAENKIDELEREMSKLQQDYESGAIDDISLASYFELFSDDPDAALAEKYNAWVKAYPRSYAARMARSLYYMKLAGLARGTKMMSDTSKDEVDGMELYVGYSLKDSEEAVALTSKPILAHENIMWLSQLTGADARGDAAWQAALAIDPETFIARLRRLNGLQTKWGGSSALMQAFMEDTKKLHLPRVLTDQLEAYMLEDQQYVLDIAEDTYKNTGQLVTGL